ncbi:signal peptide peptidase SppA [Prosthecomicrobium sp. N25]|uniref:signal peptide peptidase SppA n=1 Tax=Prosthecomicrobium sp. N25 TaxID=3129254 RepID=UPI0030781084
MSLDPDVILDRRRLKRKLGFWRIAAFVAVAVALVVGLAESGTLKGVFERSAPHVARVTISGFIRPDRNFDEMLERIAKSSSVKGVIVEINSPGGATSGGEALYEGLRKLSAKKPVVTHVDSLAASAGYMAALGTDQIVVRRSAITGSIGVLAQWADVSELMGRLGIKLEEVKSSPLKAEPTPFKPASPEAKAAIESMIRDSYGWFVGLVAERRGLSPEAARAIGDGRVFTGAQALEAKLVDQLGGPEVAQRWLETARGVPKDLPVRDWKPRDEGGVWPLSQSLAASATRGVLSALGLDGLADRALALDGLTSVWHPALSEKTNDFGGIGR